MAPGPPTPTVADAIRAGGGAVVDVTDAEALVWTDPLDVTGLTGDVQEALDALEAQAVGSGEAVAKAPRTLRARPRGKQGW